MDVLAVAAVAVVGSTPVLCVYFVHLRRHAHSPTRRHASLVFRFRGGLTGFEFRDQRPRRYVRS
jgi:hypothetical protein